MKQKVITGQGADFMHFCFAFDIHSPLFLTIKTDMSKSLTATSFLSGKREERRRGKNKNGKYHDWKSFTEYAEQF